MLSVVDVYIHPTRAPRPRPIDGMRLWRGGVVIAPLSGRYRPGNEAILNQPCFATAFAIASRNAIWRALLGFTGRPRFTVPPFNAARVACSASRCWRALLGLIGRPVRTPGADASRCWRLLFGLTGRPNWAFTL